MRWIPVGERMPEYRIPVVVLIAGCYFVIATYTDEFDGAWITDVFEEGCYKYVSGITHWMPLPEPPEELLSDEGLHGLLQA